MKFTVLNYQEKRVFKPEASLPLWIIWDINVSFQTDKSWMFDKYFTPKAKGIWMPGSKHGKDVS